MRDGYIAEYNECDCGSTTYGWIVYRFDISLGKRVKGAECGGCGKFIVEEEKIYLDRFIYPFMK